MIWQRLYRKKYKVTGTTTVEKRHNKIINVVSHPLRVTLYIFDLNSFQNRLKEVRSKISILLETAGGILFSLEGFQKMPFTIKTLRRVIYIPLEGFRYLSSGFIIPLDRYLNPPVDCTSPCVKFQIEKSDFSNPSSKNEISPVVSSRIEILLRTSFFG